MYKIIKGLPIIIFLTSLVPNVALAALVTVNISGTIDADTGSFIYPEGSTFSVRAVYDTSILDRNVNPGVGFFYDFIGETALVSFQFSTSLGSVNFQTANITEPVLAPWVTQMQSPLAEQQTFSTLYTSSSQSGFTSSVPGFLPNTFAFSLGALGPDNYLFTNPDQLFSGIENLSTDPIFLGGTLEFLDGFGRVRTGISFGNEIEMSISAVPVPAAVWLFSSGLIGLFSVALRRKFDQCQQ